jgi:hypothetical protein
VVWPGPRSSNRATGVLITASLKRRASRVVRSVRTHSRVFGDEARGVGKARNVIYALAQRVAMRSSSANRPDPSRRSLAVTLLTRVGWIAGTGSDPCHSVATSTVPVVSGL